ncbi:MAG: hypothetical protein Q9167_002780 [Letrouitia subvulpina]
MKPEARSSRGPPKHLTPNQSPDEKSSLSGRKRTRTKVVAWDPKDLEDIYQRKEILKEDWDTICRKMRDKKQQESNHYHKRSRHSNPPDPHSTPTDGIRWASVNGAHSSPAEFDRLSHPRNDDEDTSDEYDLSSAPDDSDHEARANTSLDDPPRDTPLQTRARAAVEPNTSFDAPSQPLIIQERPQTNGHVASNFDVTVAQTKGKPLAPRQPDVQMLPLVSNPPSLPEPRGKGRAKRGREAETTDSESRSSSNHGKRQKYSTDPPELLNAFAYNGFDGYAVPARPAVSMPAPQPPKLPIEAELDALCISFRVKFREIKDYYEMELKAEKIRFEAVLGRANARANKALQKLDDESHIFAEQWKDFQNSVQADTKLLQNDLKAETLKKNQCIMEAEELRNQLTALTNQAKGDLKPPNTSIEDANSPNIAEPSEKDEESLPPLETLQQEREGVIETGQKEAEPGKVGPEAQQQALAGLVEISAQHGRLASLLDDLIAKDFEDLTNKKIKKHVLDVKEIDNALSEKLRNLLIANGISNS